MFGPLTVYQQARASRAAAARQAGGQRAQQAGAGRRDAPGYPPGVGDGIRRQAALSPSPGEIFKGFSYIFTNFLLGFGLFVSRNTAKYHQKLTFFGIFAKGCYWKEVRIGV